MAVATLASAGERVVELVVELGVLGVADCLVLAQTCRALAQTCDAWLRVGARSLQCSGNVTNVGLKRVLGRCTRLQRLELVDCPRISPSALHGVVTDNLTNLKVWDCRNFGDNEAIDLARRCCGLEEFSVGRNSGSQQLSQRDYLGVSPHRMLGGHIRKLTVDDYVFPHDIEIATVMTLAPRLEALTLPTRAGARYSITLGHNVRGLRSLCLSSRPAETYEVEVRVMSDELALEELRFPSGRTGRIEGAERLTHLRFLDVGTTSQTCDYEPSIVRDIMLAPKLHELRLQHCRVVSHVDVMDIAAACTQLQALHLKDCWRVSDASVAALAQLCPGLRELDLGDCVLCGDAALAALGRHAGSLERLRVAGWRLATDAGLKALAAGGACGASLRSLDLGRWARLTDEGVLALPRWLPRLAVLDVSFCGSLTTLSLEEVARECAALYELRIAGTQVARSDAFLIAQLTRLEVTVVLQNGEVVRGRGRGLAPRAGAEVEDEAAALWEEYGRVKARTKEKAKAKVKAAVFAKAKAEEAEETKVKARVDAKAKKAKKAKAKIKGNKSKG